MRYLSLGLIIVSLSACESSQNRQPENTTFEQKVSKSHRDNNGVVRRFAPRYPINAAKTGEMGCATIEYVITPSLEITEMEVIDATAGHFATESMKVIPKWRWSNLSDDVITSPVTRRTRFEFCLKDGSNNCTVEEVNKRTSCSGEDVVVAAGSVIRRR